MTLEIGRGWWLVTSGVILVWLVIITWLWWRANRHYRRITGGVTKADLKTILERLLAQVDELKQATETLKQRQSIAEEAAAGHLQQVGFRRFNPFTDTGGDQSFCLVILDRHKSGIVISSLHSRDQTRIYAKRILAGKPEGGALSSEEEKAFKEAR